MILPLISLTSALTSYEEHTSATCYYRCMHPHTHKHITVHVSIHTVTYTHCHTYYILVHIYTVCLLWVRVVCGLSLSRTQLTPLACDSQLGPVAY